MYWLEDWRPESWIFSSHTLIGCLSRLASCLGGGTHLEPVASRRKVQSLTAG